MNLQTYSFRRGSPIPGSNNSEDKNFIEDIDYKSRVNVVEWIHIIQIKNLINLVRDLDLTKSNAQLLFSIIKKWDLLASKWPPKESVTKVFQISPLIKMGYAIEMIQAVWCSWNHHQYDEWKFFTDCSSRRLKQYLSIIKATFIYSFVDYSVYLNENYNSIKFLLQALNYEENGWQITADCKIVVFLMELKGRFTKFSWYLFLWNKKDTTEHCHKKHCPETIEFYIGEICEIWFVNKFLKSVAPCTH